MLSAVTTSTMVTSYPVVCLKPTRNLPLVTFVQQERPSLEMFGRNNSRITYRGKDILISSFYRAMTRDETRYPNPEAFIPERFLDSERMLIKDDPADFVFGFGRRICPGKSQHVFV